MTRPWPVIGALAAGILQSTCSVPPPILEWESRAPLPSPRGSYVSGFVNDRLVLAGGTVWRDNVKRWLDDVAAYDPIADAWETLPPLPRPVGYAAGATADGSLYVLGGDGPDAPEPACFRLRTADGGYRWDEIPPPPAHRSYAQAVVVGDELYLLGGSETFSDLTTASSDVFKRSLARDESPWEPVSPIPGDGRAIFTAAVAGGSIYVFGGCNADADGRLQNLRSAYAYDPAADRWRKLAEAPVPTRAWSAAALDERYIFLFGGYSGDTDATGRFESRVYRYDAELNRYDEMPAMPSPNCDIAFHLWRGAFHGAGGEPGPKRRSNANWRARLGGPNGDKQ